MIFMLSILLSVIIKVTYVGWLLQSASNTNSNQLGFEEVGSCCLTLLEQFLFIHVELLGISFGQLFGLLTQRAAQMFEQLQPCALSLPL